MAKLNDKQRKRIVAEYIEGGISQRKLAEKYHISPYLVRTILKSDEKFTQKISHKKEENTKDILAHMESKKDKVNQIIDTYLDQLLDPATIQKATPSQLTTALGTLIDKFTVAKVTEIGKTREDDPLTKALKEEAEKMNNANIE